VLHGNFAVHVIENALPTLDIEIGRVRRDVLRIHIEKYVAASRGLVRFRVVLNMIGTQTEIFVLDFNFAVGEVEVSFLALLFGFETHAGLTCRCSRRRNNFLSGGASRSEDTCDEGKEHPDAECNTEFSNSSHQFVLPFTPQKS
jgi:hypothetical protein